MLSCLFRFFKVFRRWWQRRRAVFYFLNSFEDFLRKKKKPKGTKRFNDYTSRHTAGAAQATGCFFWWGGPESSGKGSTTRAQHADTRNQSRSSETCLSKQKWDPAGSIST